MSIFSQYIKYTDSSSDLDLIDNLQAVEEHKIVNQLLKSSPLTEEFKQDITNIAEKWIQSVRQEKRIGTIESFLKQYSLSSEQGVALMCVAESLLRVPDAATRNSLIEDKLTTQRWDDFFGQSESVWVNAATVGLALTGRIIDGPSQDANRLQQVYSRMIKVSGEPFVRRAVHQAVKILGKQFVLGETINQAIKQSQKKQNKSYLYSFDMLGEAAVTEEQADNYFEAYRDAISKMKLLASDKDIWQRRPSISIKLSALEPHYRWSCPEKVFENLLARLKDLVNDAKEAQIALTIDAEEADRLRLSLQLFEALLADNRFADYQGLGLAIQAYQKRAPAVIDWVVSKANYYRRSIAIRLVKGAYWDSEIKWAQERGLKDYPVFTLKSATDLNYLNCAKKLLQSSENIYPQFATHNAHTVASVLTFAKAFAPNKEFEFQKLFGMGEALYKYVLQDCPNVLCRVYAPVGGHVHLLSYLVRRLIENGANTSFVHKIYDENTTILSMIGHPDESLAKRTKALRHEGIVKPIDIYQPERDNSAGIDFSNGIEGLEFINNVNRYVNRSYDYGDSSVVISAPYDYNHHIGSLDYLSSCDVSMAIKSAKQAFRQWSVVDVAERANILMKIADLLQENQAELVSLTVREAGRTVVNALDEIREAIDFCRYYAASAKRLCVMTKLPGPTGEENSLSWVPRGVIACISPWNFPIAIFLGQIVAALVTGNTVVAKPAEQTSLLAYVLRDMMYKAGVPKDVLHVIPGLGETVGQALCEHPDIRLVMFTGSTETAKIIQLNLAKKSGPITPLIAETGGLNAMIVDSTALLEQVVTDVLASAFDSAGQRCSALRVLCVQRDIYDELKKMLIGAMDILSVGAPTSSATDVPSLISKEAQTDVLEYINQQIKHDRVSYQKTLSSTHDSGYFVPPTLIEIEKITDLDKEIFGPVLHLVAYDAADFDNLLQQINELGYGLTLGLHTRIKKVMDKVTDAMRVGNQYVNRTTVGATVGVQPFGGMGLSGTGPKAGGPHYLMPLMHEKVVSNNITSMGGNASLLSLIDE